jgi:predicted phosphodiesterase
MTTKEELKKELLRVSDLYCKNSGQAESKISRDFYHKNCDKKYGKEYLSIYGDFKSFRSDVFPSSNIDTLKNFTDEKQIMILEEENKKLKDERKQLLKKEITTETFLEVYKSQKLNIKNPVKLTVPVKKTVSAQEAILVLSDFHCGEVIKKEEVNNINEFNFEIMKKRLDRIFFYTLFYCKKFDINKIHLFFIGDLLSGSIHPELMRTNEYNEVECLFLIQEYISEKLLQIENQFNSITCDFLVGNHSRISDGNSGTKMQWKSASIINWEYVLAKQLQIQFDLIQKNNKIKKIEIITNDSLFKVKEVAGRKFLITHGHMLSGGSNSFASIPYYGLSMSSAKLFGALYSSGDVLQEFQDIIMGHLHTSARVKTTTGNMYINGSICGTGEFGLYKMRSASQPEQLLLIVQDGFVNNEIVLRANEV